MTSGNIQVAGYSRMATAAAALVTMATLSLQVLRVRPFAALATSATPTADRPAGHWQFLVRLDVGFDDSRSHCRTQIQPVKHESECFMSGHNPASAAWLVSWQAVHPARRVGKLCRTFAGLTSAAVHKAMCTSAGDRVQPGGRVAQVAGGANARQRADEGSRVLEQSACRQYRMSSELRQWINDQAPDLAGEVLGVNPAIAMSPGQ